jgi:hypothetical protein
LLAAYYANSCALATCSLLARCYCWRWLALALALVLVRALHGVSRCRLKGLSVAGNAALLWTRKFVKSVHGAKTILANAARALL